MAEPTRKQLVVAGIAALALLAGIIFRNTGNGDLPTTSKEPTITAPAETLPPEPPPTKTPEVQPTAPTETGEEGFTEHGTPLNINLDTETQAAIYELCGRDNSLFCMTMAIASRETSGTFQVDAVGDDGWSIGIMQINTRWHTERMEALGVTDLTDPVQCAAVAIDYLQELESRYGFSPETHGILMSYNMGPKGAKDAMNAGIYCTDYSREVMALYQSYMEEMGG